MNSLINSIKLINLYYPYSKSFNSVIIYSYNNYSNININNPKENISFFSKSNSYSIYN